ncbi:HAMP domain-containing protein [Leptospira sp. 2 VSF19]|uniref:HAMP domain-containing protein n=1 Tax=Leptospira soteropolitanensis TaxID=2950025 RepID=A0AAW5VB56_9LEPT|nr:adenylate/guanylate cyclase domain-containing protein [Leptospira soteropolitanensis]MCW7492060.1 HAMP domain-containing protein [Leptospira soteropolitanensis]MCW7499642.1 HAMP domain-containing protein [Leptospira soteropolitanensis]MCW7521893.1 HAMP domain-containing protein [Leptospira soteropolitanensis]MCW7525747.1 HAMP domain-containing protein [Leptospira soteropolitanensis]MCW7530139.1 HAMP domain-containing protein [Leptospira soteropolitanensis]
MIEISEEIPFLRTSKLVFLIWDESPGSLETWDWSKGITVFFQTRRAGELEFRFGPPLWGIPTETNRLEFPFVSIHNISTNKYLASELERLGEDKTIYVLIPKGMESEARSVFARLEYLWDDKISPDRITHKFGLTGRTSSVSDTQVSIHKVSKKNTISHPPLEFVGKSGRIRVQEEILVSANEARINGMNPDLEDGVREEVFSVDDSPNHPYELIESSFAESDTSNDESSKEISLSETITTEVKEEKKEEVGAHTLDGSSETKFSLQLKMMGVISLLFALSVSVIIFFASFYFKRSIELQLRDNNIRIAEIIGSKVKSDILGVVEKGRQIAITLTTQGLPEAERKLLIKTFFQNDKEFIYLGIFERKENSLVMKREVFNEEELKKSSVTEEDFHAVVNRNRDSLAQAFNGQTVLLNSSPGFQEPSFAIAIPTAENGELDNALVMIVKLNKIIGAFSKKGIETTFMVNGNGTVLAHPKEDLVLAATDLASMPIVKSMLTSAPNTGQMSYLDEELGGSYLGSFQKIGFADAGVITFVSEEKAFADVYKSQKTNLYIAGIGLCSALIFVFFFSKTITKPVLQLLSATLEIAKGNFKIGIKPTTQDEVGLLTKYFIDMGAGLEEREKVKNILGSMIDPVVVQEAMVDLAALKRGSETHITAFFSDVASFSTISEQLKSADLAALLNEYLSAMTIILKKHEGVLDKYIGDAIVGIFNAPVPVLEHELKAARASVDMVMKLADLREYWTKNNLYSKEAQVMDARIGLNSGPAKVGFMGTDALASYTMMGDTVNLAARLEAAGKDYGVNILITDPIRDCIQGEMVTRYLDLVRVKGKNEPVKIHELIGYRSMISNNFTEAAGIYESGFKEYLNQNWNSAIKYFTEAEKAKGQKDKSSRMLMERCEEYKLNPPGSDWDGVFTRTHK